MFSGCLSVRVCVPKVCVAVSVNTILISLSRNLTNEMYLGIPGTRTN